MRGGTLGGFGVVFVAQIPCLLLASCSGIAMGDCGNPTVHFTARGICRIKGISSSNTA